MEQYNKHRGKGKTDKIQLEKIRINFPLFKDMVRKFAKTQVL